MFGFKFVKFQPTEYAIKYQNGKIVQEGAGISFFYYAPVTAIVMVPLSSSDCPFMFEEVTADFQRVSVQGQVTFRVVDQKKLATLLDYSLEVRGGQKRRVSEDVQKMEGRIGNLVRVMMKKHLENLKLADAIRESEKIAQKVLDDIRHHEEINLLGLEIMGLTVLAVTPNKETARALEAETREKILKMADDAIYERRNASIEQERGVKENEFNTEIAVENKRRQVREVQLDAERAEVRMRNELDNERLDAAILLEEKRKALIALETGNNRAQADARAYELNVMMQALKGVAPEVVKALANAGMSPQALIAGAFQDLAGRAEKIGQLNVTPDLLREMIG
ncbi:MAG: hypothetical protein LBD04_02220 [Synergistaceae bacterium]|nr:hypothetical protein [Synergistaceae bacterium]